MTDDDDDERINRGEEHWLKTRLTRRLRDAASSLGRLAVSNLLYLVLGVCTTAAGSMSR